MQKRLFLTVLAALFSLLSVFAGRSFAKDAGYYDEDYRPQYHFSPEANWMNDPNGMVYYAGEYHLFYQYYPYGLQWGPMHWGHAVSKDLVSWEQLPVALYPDGSGDMFSGGAVIDWNNTAGFGQEAMVAIYTQNKDGVFNSQTQNLAFSTDKGRTWTKYSGNPVIPNPGISDFRDPKVFWHAGTNKWIMVLAVGDRIKIYSSPNLKTWTFESDFGPGQGSHGGVWECPDLFELPVDGNAQNKKWVLQVSIGSGSPIGGSGMQYFVGSFNGHTFVNDNPAGTVLWSDYGKDYYAAVSWSDVPASDGRRLWLGWMSNWQYANEIQTTPWKSAMSIPREVKLVTTDSGVRAVQIPVGELTALREPAYTWSNQTITPSSSSNSNLLSSITGDAYEIVAEFQNNTSTASEYGFKLRKGNGQETVVGYDRASEKLFTDRTNAGASSFSPGFAGKYEAVLKPAQNVVKMRIFVDRSSVEVFGNDGIVSMTNLIFPGRSSNSLEVYASGGNAVLKSLQVYPLRRTPAVTPVVSNIGGWTTQSGVWADTISGKQGRSSDNAFIVSEHTAANFTYEADIQITDGVGKGAGALLFRGNASAASGYFANIDAVNDKVKLIKINGPGSFTELQSVNRTIDTNRSYHVKVEANGASLKVYVDGTLVIDASDGTYSSGLAGLNVWNSNTFFQNIKLAPSGVASSFNTNLSGWTNVSGTWSDTAVGKQGVHTSDGFAMAAQSGTNFRYEGKINATAGGAGALIFRANATGTNAYAANIDATNRVVKLFKIANGQATILKEVKGTINKNTIYSLKVTTYGSNIKVYVDDALLINVNDSSFSQGRYGLNVWNGTAVFQDVRAVDTSAAGQLANHDFETGNLNGWTIVSGNAFSGGDVAADTTYWGGVFNQQGVYHLWGHKDGGDSGTGELRSANFKLGGGGKIDLLVSGGRNLANLYVALVRVSDGAVLFKETGQDSENYRRVTWDASKYLGDSFYIKLVDQATGDWGHINLDDVNVQTAP